MIFPHHENEIAQSEACNGEPFAKYWMHNGYITVDGVKMSKSLGNFFTVRDIRKEFDGDFIRFFLLSVHYRNPINFSDTEMNSVKQGYDRIRNAIENLEFLAKNGNDEMTDEEKNDLKDFENLEQKFEDAMSDDLNTADAIASIFEMVSHANIISKAGASREYAKEAKEKIQNLCDIIGIMQNRADSSHEDEKIKKLVNERQEARKSKNYARADEIRDELSKMGITLKDTPQGVQIIYED